MMLSRLLLLAIFSLFMAVGTAQAQMKVHYINVGQAESILLEFKSAAVLIDAGGENTGDTRDRDHLVGYLNTFFQRRSDLNRTIHSLIVSHPHVDHTRLLMDVMNNFNVRNLVDGGGNRGSGIRELREARQFARQRNIPISMILDSGIGSQGFTTEILAQLRNSPSEVDIRFLAGFRACSDENNDSLTVLVKYKEATFLFSGDAESDDNTCLAEITHLINRYRNTGLLDVDVYKVGHHGSHNGTTRAFLRAMSPEISVISAGHHSTREPDDFHAFQFGHPRKRAVDMIEARTSTNRPTPATVYTMSAVRRKTRDRLMRKAVYCTCWDGDIVISVDETGTQLNVEPSGR
ncbi:MAG TPA: MBL fold metallo-hydrolase [Blastocatellia bacterium]|nr:MBL fold metallo-hydrolase [Blastocatellia bacterium]